jgi:beta-lactam-binding protein with PASTA domain
MRSTGRIVLVLAMVSTMFASIVGSAAAQEAQGYLAAVNGASTDPVNVTANDTAVASGVAYGVDVATGVVVPPAAYTVNFTGGTVDSAGPVAVAAGTAFTAVSGFGADGATAAGYPIDTTAIDPGMARVTVWNATTAGVSTTVTVGTDVQFDGTLPPGAATEAFTVAVNTPVTVAYDGVATPYSVITAEDSYTDVFAVNDGTTPAAAAAIVPSMTDLIAQLSPGVSVPDVVGQPAADAQAAIESAGLVAASQDQPSDTVEAGIVISTDPVGGAVVPAGSTVTATVSSGASTVSVPDVAGQSAADAQAALEAAGFVVTTSEAPSTDVEAGLVIETSPVAGTEVAPGTTVNLVVSTGPGDVAVPDFSGMTQAEATTAAEDIGLTITFVEDTANPDPDGIVIDQTPDPGAIVPAGTEVVADLSPLTDDPWTILTLDPDRLMTVTGVNYLPESTVNLSIEGTNLTESVVVGSAGSWVAYFDLSDVENEAETLIIKGVAADGTDYEASFKIPAGGGEVVVVVEEESGGFPWWGWLAILLGIVGIGALIAIIMRKDDGADDTETSADAS